MTRKTGVADSDAPTLTTRQEHPVVDNQNNRTVGDRGPTVLENYHFLEKISHFDRERIPERVVHARGAGAHGFFEAYGTVGDEPISRYTRARLFQERGKRTPMFARFSTVIHGNHSPETFQPADRQRLNLVNALLECDRDTQERMVGHLRLCGADYGQRVVDGIRLGIPGGTASPLPPPSPLRSRKTAPTPAASGRVG